jgi:HPt (histidine-containing phosphotransfer) domain-containing protein
VDALKAAIDQNEPKEVARQAHGLKSAVSYFGAKRLCALCSEIETQAFRLKKESLNEKYETLLAEFNLLLQAARSLQKH